MKSPLMLVPPLLPSRASLLGMVSGVHLWLDEPRLDAAPQSSGHMLRWCLGYKAGYVQAKYSCCNASQSA